MKTKETIKKLQEIAKQNGFYLMPESLYNEMGNTIVQLRKDRDNLRIVRDKLKKQIKVEKNNG